MARGLEGKVVVITGASSGIGRCAARAFGAAGASVVLSARREVPLHEVAGAIVEAGGRAMVVPADVRDADAMRHLAERAIDAFGAIDVWINNAGVASFGRFEDTPAEAFDAVMATTFHGVVNGFRAVLPYFRRRGHGTVITTASVAGRAPAPYHAAYGAAKHAVLGLIESVRQELRQDGLRDVHLCSILPGPVDTPFWQHAANFSGREIRAMQPASRPEDVAEAMVNLALRPRREVGIGAPAWLVELGMAVAQGPIERQMGRSVRRQILGGRPGRRSSDGALHRPMPEGTGETGGWRPAEDRGRTRRGGAMAGALALAVPLGIAALYRYRRSD
ncbi:SDR family NAD(P)-dependent oxidoreductase [Arenibaculum pallidiluteum]|uniref:SDR family NAD(P)-dependent oxidoreductase n=1 Tax=Arenibaculum pallidiluteum TaxID=2812559 RepID=UPI001A96EE41|nr:SDR family NAD(P)-dependent oxidoreductase [Arenibaculum pallidiluteum]